MHEGFEKMESLLMQSADSCFRLFGPRQCGVEPGHVHVFLILKVRHPAVTGGYCIVRDSRSGCSNDFKCTGMEATMQFD